MRHQEHERERTQDRKPDHIFPSEPVAEGASKDGADSNRGQEQEEMQLGVLHGHVERANEIERVIARDAREIEIFREDQDEQYPDRKQDAAARESRIGLHRLGRFAHARQAVGFVPDADIPQNEARQKRYQRIPSDAALAPAQDDKRGRQRAQSRADVSANLEYRLSKTI